MKKHCFTIALFALMGFNAHAQSKIKDGTVTGSSILPAANAILELESTGKGFILPRVALTGTTDITTIPAPVNGMVVYATLAQGNVKPGLHYFDNGSWKRLPYVDQASTDTTANATISTFAYAGPFTGQNINGIKVGDFSFKIARRSGDPYYTTTNETIDVQLKYDGPNPSMTIASFANTLWNDIQYDYSNINVLAPTATSASSAARSNNVMTPGLWYGWGEEGFETGAHYTGAIDKRQYILTPMDGNEKYFYRVEFFLADPTPNCAACTAANPSENDAKVLIYIEYIKAG